MDISFLTILCMVPKPWSELSSHRFKTFFLLAKVSPFKISASFRSLVKIHFCLHKQDHREFTSTANSKHGTSNDCSETLKNKHFQLQRKDRFKLSQYNCCK